MEWAKIVGYWYYATPHRRHRRVFSHAVEATSWSILSTSAARSSRSTTPSRSPRAVLSEFFRKFHLHVKYLLYLCSRKGFDLSTTFWKIRSVMLNLVIVNVGNSLRTRISIVVLTLIAWVTIVTSVQMVSYDLQSRRGIVGSRSMVICSVNVARNSTSHRSSSPKNSIASRATSPVSRTAKPTFNCRASSASQPSSASSSFLHT